MIETMKRTTTDIGGNAESMAADFLERKGFKILQRNWKTRCCEIDLVAQKCWRQGLKNICRVHVVEVKYRKSNSFGLPEEYVTPSKQRQLIRAAEHWSHEQNWKGPIQIDVIGIDGYAGTVAYVSNITS